MSKRATRDIKLRKFCAWNQRFWWWSQIREIIISGITSPTTRPWRVGSQAIRNSVRTRHRIMAKLGRLTAAILTFQGPLVKAWFKSIQQSYFQSHTGQPSASRIGTKVEWIRLPSAAARPGPRALGQAHPAGKSPKSHHGPRPLTFRLTQPTNQVFTHKR